MNMNISLPFCSTLHQLHNIYNATINLKIPMSHYDPPCNEMTVVTTFNRQPYANPTNNPMNKLLFKNKPFLNFISWIKHTKKLQTKVILTSEALGQILLALLAYSLDIVCYSYQNFCPGGFIQLAKEFT